MQTEPTPSYPLGVLYAAGDLSPVAEQAEFLHHAGLRYAALHFAARNGIRAPRSAIPGHLSKPLVSIIGAPSENTPEEQEKLRAQKEVDLRGARQALLRASPMSFALMIVDRVCIDELPLAYAGAHQDPLKHLLAGLGGLVEHFELDKSGVHRDKPERKGFGAHSFG